MDGPAGTPAAALTPMVSAPSRDPRQADAAGGSPAGPARKGLRWARSPLPAWTGLERRDIAPLLALGGGALVPVMVSWSTGLLLLALAVAAFEGRYRGLGAALARHPLTPPALALSAWLLLSLLWDQAPLGEALHGLKKYRELLLLVALLPLFRGGRWRRWGIRAFVGVMLLTLLLSLLKASGLVHLGGTDAGTVFKNRITQNLFMALAAWQVGAWALAGGGWRRRALGLLWALMAFDCFFLVGGRTGQLVFVALGLWFFYRRLGVKALGWALVALPVLGLTTYVGSDVFRGRVDALRQSLGEYREGGYTTSTALRLSYYRNALGLIGERPLCGYGVGAFETAYRAWVRGTPYPPTRHPHNEYLMLGVQGGLVAAGLFLWLLWRQWRAARSLDPEARGLAEALVMTFALGCLLNSFLYDSTEAHLWAWLSALLYAGLWPGKAAA